MAAAAAVVAALALGIAGIVWLVQPDDPPAEETSALDGGEAGQAAGEPLAAPDPAASEPGELGEVPGRSGQPREDDGAAAVADMHSPEGYAALLDTLRGQSGATEVFRAVLYPEYASIDLPADAKTQRSDGWHYDSLDGSFEESTIKSTSDYERIDLAAVDPALLGKLLRRVAKLVDDPTSTYVIIEGKSTIFDDDGARISAYASNDYSESAYIATKLDGTLVRTVRP